MSADLATQIRDYLDTIRTPVTPDDLVVRPETHPQRRPFSSGPAVALAAAAVVLLISVPLLFVGGPNNSVGSSGGAEEFGLGVDYVWPAGGFPGTAEELATEFASTVLGWSEATIRSDPDADPDGPVWTDISVPGETELSVLSVPIQEGGRVLLQVGSLGVTLNAEALDGGTGQMIGIPTVAGAVAVKVHYRIASSDESFMVDAGPSELNDGRIGIAQTEPIGSVLVLYKDSAGETITAAGGHFGPFDAESRPASAEFASAGDPVVLASGEGWAGEGWAVASQAVTKANEGQPDAIGLCGWFDVGGMVQIDLGCQFGVMEQIFPTVIQTTDGFVVTGSPRNEVAEVRFEGTDLTAENATIDSRLSHGWFALVVPEGMTFTSFTYWDENGNQLPVETDGRISSGEVLASGNWPGSP